MDLKRRMRHRGRHEGRESNHNEQSCKHKIAGKQKNNKSHLSL